MQIDIATNQALADLCENAEGQAYITLDTEFIRERTFFPVLALIQVSWPGQEPVLIDPLPITNWDPFHELLCTPETIKVLHSSRQDLEIFFNQMGTIPKPVFDTQIAASMCGFGDQISYAALIAKTLGVQLKKGDSFTNWLQRPLTEAQVRYARDDVAYLPDAYEKLVELAEKQGRLKWIQQETRDQLNDNLFRNDPENLWRKVKKVGQLKEKDLVVMQALAVWRDKKAREQDKPVRFVLSDEVMVELAKMDQLTLDSLRSRRGIHPKFVNRFGEHLLKIHAEAREVPKSQWPRLKESRRRGPSSKAENLADLAWILIKEIAQRANMAPANIILKRELAPFIDATLQGRDTSQYGICGGWRKEMVGDLLIKLLDGQMTIRVENHHIIWDDHGIKDD
ncbi:ribonuclease D [Acanthopleuribacter pedis]|uniref:Ribonuclease D n=1 Tax=Acanthopleuribacter pedis TaxID=442870 RepID=A0A8J7QE20_9BACT|nr:ribonuclease D [Acanthopleuribacter pedis]MBO1322129.1 ribonuclease D [Acanthopleuribacter pedis]